jgi:hypothetical protein
MGWSTPWVVTGAILAVAYSWYIESVWPVAVAALVIALEAFLSARVVARATGLMSKLTHPPAPLTMVFEFTVLINNCAWEFLKLTPQELTELGNLEPRDGGFVLEIWGRSFMRRRIFRVRDSAAERVQDLYPHDRTIAGYHAENVPVHLWEKKPPVSFVLQGDEVMLFAGKASIMPDGTLHDPGRVLFRFKFPLKTMQPFARRKWCAELERFFVHTEARGDGSYYRVPGQDLYECKEDGKGLSWTLIINDLRPQLTARITKVHKTLWKRELLGFTVQFDETGQKLWASAYAVEPPLDVPAEATSRPHPRRGDVVSLVVDDDFTVERIWWVQAV